MFHKKFKAIVAVHDDQVFWITSNRTDAGRCVLQMPLEQVLTDKSVSEQIPKSIRGNHKTLCIVPDHWFGMESYPFQSKKPALIEPFLERKLTAAYPEQKEMRHFFNYKSLAAEGAAQKLLAYFLQEPNSYRLYDALNAMNLAPLHITTPGFLWAGQLARTLDDFDREGTLLIHMGAGECQLYFYFKGNFLFSRNVVLSDGQDRMEALTFEISQSLYMFSQKTKSELTRILLLSAAPGGTQTFGQALGREVIDLDAFLADRPTLAIDEVPVLKGLLRSEEMATRIPRFSVIHRQVKYGLAWKPVQWAGILIGMALLLPLLGETLLLSDMLRQEAIEHHRLKQQMNRSTDAALTEYEDDIDRVLTAAERPVCSDTIRRILSSLPPGVRVQELDLVLEGQPAVSLKATLPARDAEHLKVVLTRLAAGLRTHFSSAPDFSVNKIEIHQIDIGKTEIGLDLHGEQHHPQRYLIALKWVLT